MRKVLVLEDEENIRSFVVINLKRAGYTTIEAGTGEDALVALKENPDVKVALLDIMLPGIDGFEVCRRIRAMDNKIGIIMLTARTQEMDKVTGLMTGADDYVTKPFSPAELTARIDALCRRAGEGLAAIPGMEVFRGPGQTGVLSFRHRDIPAETLGEDLSRRGVALRTGLHCAPLAHESAGTLETGTLRASFSVFNREEEVETFLGAVEEVCRGKS